MKTNPDDVSTGSHDECSALFAEALQGDHLAAARLYSRCVPHLRNWLAGRFNITAVEDLAHDAMVIAFQKSARFQPGTSFQSWLKTIASRLALNLQRDETRRRSREMAYVQLETINAKSTDTPDPARAAQLANCLLTLPEPQRHLLHLRFFEGQSADAIASAQGRKRGAVAVSLHRICRRLRDGLDSVN